jgi:O-acetyl-ADP-ribose deacetylase (regulator of RNase III)
MSAEPSESHETMHPIRVMMELQHAKPRRTGSIIVRKGSPVRFLAIVHDVNQEPITREEWVFEALHGLFEKAGELGITSISMPLLAARHGRLPVTRLAELLGEILCRNPEASFPRKLWVMAPVPDNSVFMDALEESLRSHGRL